MKQTEIKHLENWVKKFFINRNKDYKTFDINSEIDNSLCYEENKQILREKIKTFIGDIKDVDIMSKEQAKHKFQQQLNQFEEQADKEFNRILNKIETDNTTSILEDIYYIPKQFTKMIADKKARGFLLFGKAGLGKTYSVIRAFREVKTNFVLLAGHITSLEFYHFLFENRNKHIVLDDVNVLDNEQNLNMLKACLSDNSRVVQYHTTSSKLKVPNKFLFNGSIVLLLNVVPKKSESLKAVESRILTYELKMDYKTKIQIIFELAKQPYKEIERDKRFKIAKWIKNNTNEATENLNLRLLFNCYEFYRFDCENWIKLAEKIIKTNEELYLIVQGLVERDWCEKTGLSRRSYYNYKEKLLKVQKCNDFGI